MPEGKEFMANKGGVAIDDFGSEGLLPGGCVNKEEKTCKVEIRINSVVDGITRAKYKGDAEMGVIDFFKRKHGGIILKGVEYALVQLWYGNEYIAFQEHRFLAAGDVVTFSFPIFFFGRKVDE